MFKERRHVVFQTVVSKNSLPSFHPHSTAGTGHIFLISSMALFHRRFCQAKRSVAPIAEQRAVEMHGNTSMRQVLRGWREGARQTETQRDRQTGRETGRHRQREREREGGRWKVIGRERERGRERILPPESEERRQAEVLGQTPGNKHCSDFSLPNWGLWLSQGHILLISL